MSAKKKTHPHLLIDGYNIIHAWDSFSSIRRNDMPSAVSMLAEKVRVIHDLEGIRTTLVFDGNGSEISIERPSNELTFSLVFTPKGMTADDFIEQLVHNAKDPSVITAVTQDTLLRTTVESAGGFVYSAESFFDWVDHCYKQQRQKAKDQTIKTNKQWKLNDDAWNALG